LHLLSNWKWTERSEPAVDLALAQTKLGTRVMFVSGRPPGRAKPEGSKFDVAYHARLKGLSAVDSLNLPKHFRIRAALQDFRKLKRLLQEFRPDIIHCHMSSAHMLAGLVRKTSRTPLIIKSSYNPVGPRNNFRSRFLYRRCTDGIALISAKAKEQAISANGFSPESVLVAEPGIDLERFAPLREIAEGRESFGLAGESFVVGVVSRIRASRRIDIPLAAIHALAERYPHLKLLVVGRGSDGAVDTLVNEPARQMQIADRVISAGYCRGDRLVAAYRAMDVLVYPTSGTDKSCRTVREAMAAGLAVLAPNIGFLPELINDGVNGMLMDGSGKGLAGIISGLIEDTQKLNALCRQALKTATDRFSPALQAEKIQSFYEKLLSTNR
jgi:glycosyltransferase involved in cell wall biosynthesis